MAVSRDEIADMLHSIERYNPANLDLFARFLVSTCADGSYFIEASLAILKLYQFNPNKFDLETTRTILLKALTSLPSSDFTLCLYLLTEEQLSNEAIAPLLHLSSLLESCAFKAFWDYLAAHPKVLQCKVRVDDEDSEHVAVTLSNFHQSVRNFVGYIVKISYQTIKADLLKSMLGSPSDAELAAFVAQQGWSFADATTVHVARQDALIKSKHIVESIRFDSLVPLMVASQPLQPRPAATASQRQ